MAMEGSSSSSSRVYPVSAGQYKLFEEIGCSPSSTVYRALCLLFNEVVAIKTLDLESSSVNLVSTLTTPGSRIPDRVVVVEPWRPWIDFCADGRGVLAEPIFGYAQFLIALNRENRMITRLHWIVVKRLSHFGSMNYWNMAQSPRESHSSFFYYTSLRYCW